MTTQNERATIPGRFCDLLESMALAHVATIGPKGEPQSNPVWFGWDGEHVEFNQTKTRRKCRNVNRDPRAALSAVDRIEEDPDLDFIGSMSSKYLGVYPYRNHRPGGERVVVFVRPEHTTQKEG